VSAPYVPPHFEENDDARLHAAMREYPFGTIVTSGPDGLIASHLPFLLEPEYGEHGRLWFHFARPNPQWRAVTAQTEALAIFLGPHAYVSPSWYATQRETGKVVPTWNYLAVHAYGPLEVFEDPETLRDLVTRLTAAHEGALPEPWKPSDAPGDYIATQLRGIVGLRMPIRRLYGKWKMSQNRPSADRAGAIEALETSERADDRATAEIMRELHTRPDLSVS
jgi:transcriptional regulator